MLRTSLFCILLILLSCTIFYPIAFAGTIDLPVKLKVNDFYILYTHPKGPYLNAENRLMVPLGVFCRRLMGADVEFDSRTKTAMVAFHGKTARLTVGSEVADLDGNPMKMAGVPVLRDGYVFVPLRTLTDAFSIPVDWNQEYHYVSLSDQRLMDTWTIRYLLDSSPGTTDNNEAFIPTKVTLSSRQGETGSTWVKLDITAKNITGADIPAGKEDLHPYIVYNAGYSHDPGVGHEGSYIRERPFIGAGDTIERSMEISFDPTIDKINYILLWCRTLT